jgi:nitroreductase
MNILYAAKSKGLDGCWCGAFDEMALASVLNLPKEHRPVGLIPIGYAANDNPKPSRRPLEEVITIID